jgi:uncharacterized protein
MTEQVYRLTVPAFNKLLGALSKILDKAKAVAEEKKFDESVLVNARLAPDMFALARQVQVACDFAKGCAARLSETEVPKYEDSEKTLDELKARIQKTLEFINSIDVNKFANAAERIVKTKLGGIDIELPGLDYVRETVLPNFFFHLSMCYAILRHNGVPIGKLDFVGRV